MLRVLVLSTLFPNTVRPTFGIFVENQTLRLAARREIELRVVNPIAMPPFPLHLHARYRELHRLPREEDWKGLRVARPRFPILPGLSGPINPSLLFRAARPVLRFWQSNGFPFDVIDAQFFYPDGPAAARLAMEFGVPFSIKARGADIHYWGALRRCRRQLLAAAAQAHGLLAAAQSLRRDMVGMGMHADKISVHYTGVDLEQFRPFGPEQQAAAKAVLRVSGPLVVSVGALIPRKAHEIVIEAICNIKDATLLIVGDGPEHSRLAALVRTRGLTERVRLLGSMPHAEVSAILAAADVMALVSRSEGLANTWVEALACGTPIVISDVDGAREVVDRLEAGRLVQTRTPDAVAEAISAVLANPPAREAVRVSAERFAWRRNTLQLYEHLTGLTKSGHCSALSSMRVSPGDENAINNPASSTSVVRDVPLQRSVDYES